MRAITPFDQVRSFSQNLIHTKVKTVLIIDDSKDLSNQLSDYLRESNLEVIGIEHDLVKAEKKICKLNPDALVVNLDIKGDFSGFQIAKFLKLEYDLPFIMIQAKASHDLDKWTTELNPDGVIYQDQTKEDILATIGKVFT